MNGLPNEIINHILSFRERHPIASIVASYRETLVESVKDENMYGFDDAELEEYVQDLSLYALLVEVSDFEPEPFTERTLGWRRENGDDLSEWCKRAQIDYHFIYARNGDGWWGENYNEPPFDYRRNKFWQDDN